MISIRPFQSVLVANRGEIAIRVFRACDELGLRTLGIYSQEDKTALHRYKADETYLVGEDRAPLQAYLAIDEILTIARRHGADAIHPGYGFLSENPAFARACEAAGIAFIGPPAGLLERMGDKVTARETARSLSIPVIPGTREALPDAGAAAAAAAEIGYPVILKAAFGGGGRGMRVAANERELRELFEAATREAEGAFGRGDLFLEKYLVGPRHIEVQVLADGHGHVVHLFERDCTVQRRHQKVIEESPSPALTPALRAEMGAAAVRLARAIGYTGAGTVEFLLVDEGFGDGNDPGAPPFAFLEMNTRLQVEHGVTELVTGLDLVHLQLRVAAGEPLPLTQDGVRLRGHAIQCRVYAEDPAQGYLPSAGRLTRFCPPAGPGVRNDLGFYEGAEVPSYYDALLAKLLVWGEDRREASRRAAAALDRYEIEGVATNLGLLRATVRHPEFGAGHTYTSFLDEHVLPGLAGNVPPLPALLGAAAFDLLAPAAAGPWTAGPWRPAGTPVRLVYRTGAAEHTVEAVRLPGDAWDLTVADAPHRVTLEAVTPGRLLVREGGIVHAVAVEAEGDTLRVTHGDRTVTLTRPEPLSVAATGHAGAVAGGPKALTAPLAGVVVKVAVAAGETVRARTPLVVLEAMKMEHTIEAPSDGTVTKLHRAVGDRVQAGDVLVELDPA